MRTLTIVRHAKAEAGSLTAKDIDRDLAPRGKKDIKRMAKLITKVEPRIDLIVSSPAARARQTAEIMARELNFTHSIQWEDEIYNANAVTLLAVLQSLPEDAQHIAFIGHNPGMEGLVAGLSSGSTHRLNVRMPTAAMATLALEVYWWNQVQWGCGQLQLLIKPKLLRNK